MAAQLVTNYCTRDVKWRRVYGKYNWASTQPKLYTYLQDQLEISVGSSAQ